jgi:hypothetical protein
MNAKTIRGLVLLAALSLLCASVAWAVDHAVFGLIFSALSGVAVLGAAVPPHLTDMVAAFAKRAGGGNRPALPLARPQTR